MRPRLLAFLLAVALASTVTGCSDDGGGAAPTTEDPPTSAQEAGAEPLPMGKDDLELDEGGSYLSPEGFVPQLRIDLTSAGWTSVHRGADGFDVGQADPDRDAPLVAVAFLVPPEDTAEAALAAVRDRADAAGGTVKELRDPLGPFGATGVDVRNGAGPLVASRDGGIALDAMPGGRARVWAADVAGAPILVVVLAPDASLFGATAGAVQQLLDSVTPA
jgi:hypothetical protein